MFELFWYDLTHLIGIWRVVLGNSSAFLFAYEQLNDVLRTIQAKLFRVVFNYCQNITIIIAVLDDFIWERKNRKKQGNARMGVSE